MTRLGQDLLRSARQAEAIARGEADPSAYRVHVPDDVDVRAVRIGLGLTQERFAARFGFAVSAVRDWEHGRRRPDRSARVLLQVIAREPEAVDRALGIESEPRRRPA